MAQLKKIHSYHQLQQGIFSSLDIHFANFINRLAKTETPELFLAAALVSSKTGAGHICLDLNEFAGREFPAKPDEHEPESIICPPLSDWADQLTESGVAGLDNADTPLVLDRSGRLYLRRYWEYERSIIRFIEERCNATMPELNHDRLARDVGMLFPSQVPGKTDWQKIAAVMAVTRSFCVISGGPGTGKTATVARILALLAGQFADKEKLRIVLGAPTGKAASRLQEAIAATGLLQGKIDTPRATTLHRMLGTIMDSPYFRHNADNPLEADIVVVDEASMVDLPLLAKLMAAVPHTARLVLLGDRHQLASVQPGAVLGDICRSEFMNSFSTKFRHQITALTGETLPPEAGGIETLCQLGMQDSFVELIDSYRFPEESSIGKLSRAVKAGNDTDALDLLLADGDKSVSWSDIPAPAELEKKLRDWPGFPNYAAMQQADADACFEILNGHRILCGLRRGPFGMARVNALLTHALSGQNKTLSARTNLQPGQTLPSLVGQPVMITQNDYSLKLFNGDVGIILPDPKGRDAHRVFFRQESGDLRDIGLALLPAHETVFAMTVHKSQGSEFDRVLLILPDQDAPLLTRELLYTAITRAREKVEIWGKKDVFRRAVKRQILRTSGLADGLWNSP